MKRITGGARLVSPTGEPWRSAALELSADGVVPLVDLHSAMSHSIRVELARHVLDTVAGEQPLAQVRLKPSEPWPCPDHA